MCGICGVIGNIRRGEASEATSRMLAAQVHRGPDGSGAAIVAENPAACIGNRRLAIVDLSKTGDQPMVGKSGATMVYNGELYNAPQIRSELEAAGASFTGTSDTEVALQAFERWGPDAFSRFSGMFALAIWDPDKHRLTLARDPLGIKPLYYSSTTGGQFVFASEVKAMTASGLVRPTISRAGLASFLAYGSVQEPLTILEGVRCLPPATWLAVGNDGGIHGPHRYWDFPSPVLGHSSIQENVIEARRLLEAAVGRHLMSDVPVGVFLSSGLDSTAVAGLAAKASKTSVNTFTVTFPDEETFDEGVIARETATRLGTDHHEKPITSATACKWIEKALDSMDQPSMDGANSYLVSKAVHEGGIKVALSGQGGDEVFGGYSSFRDVPSWNRGMALTAAVPQRVRSQALAFVGGMRSEVARRKAADIGMNGAEVRGLYLHYRRLMSDSEMGELVTTPSRLGLDDDYQPTPESGPPATLPRDAQAAVRMLECSYYMRNTLLRDGDVFGMANSLEIRVPLLDRELVEWACGLPGPSFMPRGKPAKFLLREACREFYSPEQLRRPKRGFTLPISRWLQGPLSATMDRNVRVVKDAKLVDSTSVDRLVQRFERQPDSAAWSRVWAVVALGAWLSKNEAMLEGNQ